MFLQNLAEKSEEKYLALGEKCLHLWGNIGSERTGVNFLVSQASSRHIRGVGCERGAANA